MDEQSWAEYREQIANESTPESRSLAGAALAGAAAAALSHSSQGQK